MPAPDTCIALIAAFAFLAGCTPDRSYEPRNPLGELVVSPVAIFDAPELITVYEN